MDTPRISLSVKIIILAHDPHNEAIKYISTPYIPALQKELTKFSERKFNIVLSNKHPIPLNSKSNVVYQLSCNYCNDVFIGETKNN